MAVKTVDFSYTVGSARFTSSVDIPTDDWDEMDFDDRVQHLERAAMSEIEDMLEVDENSIED